MTRTVGAHLDVDLDVLTDSMQKSRFKKKKNFHPNWDQPISDVFARFQLLLLILRGKWKIPTMSNKCSLTMHRNTLQCKPVQRFTLMWLCAFVYLAETPRAANGWRMCVCCNILFCSTLSRMFLRRTRARLSSPLHTSWNTRSISCLRMSSVNSTTLTYTHRDTHISLDHGYLTCCESSLMHSPIYQKAL